MNIPSSALPYQPMHFVTIAQLTMQTMCGLQQT